MSRRWVCTIAFAAALWPCPAAAQTPDKPPAATAADTTAARDLFREGARLAKEGKWEDARRAFERSYSLRPSTLTQYNLAMAQKETGRFVDAAENLRAFLREAGDHSTADYRAPAADTLRSIEPKIGRITISVQAPAPGTQVRLDGTIIPSASWGVRRPIDPGHHRIEAQAAGYKPLSQEFDVAEGGSVDKTIVLEKAPEAAAPSASITPPPVQPTATNEPSLPKSRNKTLPIALTAGGGALLIGGVVVGLVGVGKAKDSPTSEGADADSARSLALVGDIMAGVGLVAAGVGTYLLLTSSAPSERPSSAALRLSPWVDRNNAGVRFLTSF